MSEQELEDLLTQLLLEDVETDDGTYVTEARSFEAAEIPTHQKGVVVTTSTGDEFQLTIVRSG